MEGKSWPWSWLAMSVLHHGTQDLSKKKTVCSSDTQLSRFIGRIALFVALNCSTELLATEMGENWTVETMCLQFAELSITKQNDGMIR